MKGNMEFDFKRELFGSCTIFVNKDKEFVQYLSNKEGDVDNITVYVKQFFSTIGYQILYDTNS